MKCGDIMEGNYSFKIVYDDGKKITCILTNFAQFRVIGNHLFLITKDEQTQRKQILNSNRIIRITYLTQDEAKIEIK